MNADKRATTRRSGNNGIAIWKRYPPFAFVCAPSSMRQWWWKCSSWNERKQARCIVYCGCKCVFFSPFSNLAFSISFRRINGVEIDLSCSHHQLLLLPLILFCCCCYQFKLLLTFIAIRFFFYFCLFVCERASARLLPSPFRMDVLYFISLGACIFQSTIQLNWITGTFLFWLLNSYVIYCKQMYIQ